MPISEDPSITLYHKEKPMLTHPTLDKLQALKLMGMYHALLEQMQIGSKRHPFGRQHPHAELWCRSAQLLKECRLASHAWRPQAVLACAPRRAAFASSPFRL